MTDLEFLQQQTVREFILAQEHTDPLQLILNPPKEFKDQIQLITDQITSRQKAKKKLPNWHHNHQLILPPPLSIEQSSSETAANYKQQLMKGKALVDLTGGMGIDTLALSKGFDQTTYIEQNPWLSELFQHNTQKLNSAIIVLNQTAEQYLASAPIGSSYFIDPARRDDHKNKVFRFEDCTPNVIELLPALKEKAYQVLIKASPLIDLRLGFSSLNYVVETHVIAIKNEVKEVLFKLDFTKEPSENITCINLESSHSPFTFNLSNEHTADGPLGQRRRYLYDPNASILKAGGFKSIAIDFGLIKLASNTHLYTSEKILENFPGRIFEVISEVTKKNIKGLLPDSKANIITKNYPIKPEELKKKYKLKDGGDWYILGFKNSKNQPQIVLAKLVK